MLVPRRRVHGVRELDMNGNTTIGSTNLQNWTERRLKIGTIRPISTSSIGVGNYTHRMVTLGVYQSGHIQNRRSCCGRDNRPVIN